MERRTEKVRIRLTPEELEHLKKCSSSFTEGRFQNGGENFSAYLREKLLKESSYKNVQLERQLGNLRYELRKIGVNVNQIARKINSGFGTPGDLTELRQHMDHIEHAISRLEMEVKQAWRSPG